MSRRINKKAMDKQCCGGVFAGRDFCETDRDAPKCIRYCFKNTKKDWNPRPCTRSDSSKCCPDGGVCEPTNNGGWCRNKKGSRNIYYKYYHGYKRSVRPQSNEEKINLKFKKCNESLRCSPFSTDLKKTKKLAESKKDEETNYTIIIIVVVSIVVGVPLLWFLYKKFIRKY